MFESLTGEQTQTQNNDVCVAWDGNALQYLADGYSVIPLAPKQKGPKLSGWSKYCEELMPPNEAQSYFGKNNNIGLCMGPASNLCAVDIDTDDPDIIRKIEKILPYSSLRKKGAKGFTIFYKYNGMASKSVKDDYGNGVDFLSTGRQTVLPPSVHPSGMEYQWLGNTTLLDVNKRDLPDLPISAVEQVLALFKPAAPAPKPKTPTVFYKDATLDEAKHALTFLDADYSYDQWLQVGLALQEGFGDEKGFELFNEWSAQGKQGKYEGTAKCYKKYKSLEDPREITLSTLFFLARQNGYTGLADWGIANAITDGDAEKFDEVVSQWFGASDALSKDQALDIILHPVGFVKPVYDWVKKTSMYQQDLFAVAAAVSFVSLIYAKRFKSPTGARTNNYLIAVGPAGCGKGRVCDQAQWLVAHAPDSIRSKLVGKLRSDAGLIDALLDREGILYAYIDEIGHYLRNIKSDNSSQYTRAIGSEFIELFSHANGTYSTGAYSAAAKRSVVNMRCPCLVIFGQSVPNRLFDSLSKADFEDGFIPRFTLLEVKPKDRIPLDNPDFVCPEDYYPDDIYKFVKWLESWVNNAQAQLDLVGKATGQKDTALTVPYTPGAEKMLEDIKNDINNKRRVLLDTDLIDRPLGRAWEQICKYALCACEWQNDRPVITEASVKWAKALVDYHLMVTEEHIPDITDTSYAKDRVRMTNAMPVGVKMTDKMFHTFTRDIQPNIRKQIMDDLIHQGVLEWEIDGDNKFLIRRQ